MIQQNNQLSDSLMKEQKYRQDDSQMFHDQLQELEERL